MKCIYIYNPTSGRQNKLKQTSYIVKTLKTMFDEVVCAPTTKQGDATVFAKNACGKFDALVVSGGDGTINEVINGVAAFEVKPIIGIIPTGTTNDLAHSLNIPKNLKKALKIILNQKTTMHDVFKVNNKFGIYVCAFGLFTSASFLTNKKNKKRFGKLAYYTFGVKELNKFKLIPTLFCYNNEQKNYNVALCVIANSKYVAGHKIKHNVDINDGLVDVYLIENNNTKLQLKTVLKIVKLFLFKDKSIEKNKMCTHLKLSKFEVKVPDEITINLDGEAGLNGTFNFEVIKNCVQIFVK